jgi:flagellar secretion chaperone FliS
VSDVHWVNNDKKTKRIPLDSDNIVNRLAWMTDILVAMNPKSNEYLRNTVMTATPEQLHLMLYDGAIRFARQGMEGIQQKNYEQAYNGFSRAQKIVLEMLNSLNYDVDRNLCEKMAGLYTFIYRRLVDASSSRNVEMAHEAINLLNYQRETWVMLIEQLRQEKEQQQPDDSAEYTETEQGELQAVGSDYGSLSVEG